MALLFIAAATLLLATAVAVLLLGKLRGAASGGAPAGGPGAPAGASPGEAAAAAVPPPSGPRVLILYATQTGTSERFAKGLRSQLESKFGSKTSFDVECVESLGEGISARIAAEKLVVILASTYGDGEPTDDAVEFAAWARKLGRRGQAVRVAKGLGDGVLVGSAEEKGLATLTQEGAALGEMPDEDDEDDGDEEEEEEEEEEEGSSSDEEEASVAKGAAAKARSLPLNKLSFAVFALGNRQYEYFCAVGRKLQVDLVAAGARPVAPLGIGDDDADVDADFDAWSADLLGRLEARPDLVEPEAAGSDGKRTVKIRSMGVEPVGAPGAAADALPDGCGTSHNDAGRARVVEARELHGPTSERSCVHVELDLTGLYEKRGGRALLEAARAGTRPPLYAAGDHVAVLPENPTDVAERVAARLGLEPGAIVRFSAGDASSGSLPGGGRPVSVRAALARSADLLGPPSKAALAVLGAIATDEGEAAELTRMASPAGAAEYHETVSARQLSLVDVLDLYRSATPSLGVFFGSVAEPLQPRYYSISSSPLRDPARLTITVAVVREPRPDGRVRIGVASSWLAGLVGGGDGEKATTVAAFLRASTFRLPRDPAAPIAMVGPGTGLAPFRGFLQEREALAARRRRAGAGDVATDGLPSSPLGPASLFFGCRRHDTDYIYRDELEKALEAGVLTELSTAFSREGAEKVYVQHRLYERRDAIWELLAPGGKGTLYICGDGRSMAKDVLRTLADIVKEKAGMSDVDAEVYVNKLGSQGRLHKDVW